MRFLRTRQLAFAAFAFSALCAGPSFAQNRTTAAANAAQAAIIQQQQQQLGQQQMYNQGQAAIQGGTQGHVQSQQMLSNMSERNQSQLDAQTPHYPTSPTTTGDLH